MDLKIALRKNLKTVLTKIINFLRFKKKKMFLFLFILKNYNCDKLLIAHRKRCVQDEIEILGW